MSKQTAVEYLLHELHASGFIEDITDPLLIQRVKEALQTEREQIVEAFQTEWSAYNCSGNKYYERTYGNKVEPD